MPEDSLSNILQHLHSGEKLTVRGLRPQPHQQIASGTLSNADNQIDTTTGTLKLRAMFDNSKLELFPNQFVNVQLMLDTLHNQIVVPGAAVQKGSQGSYVYRGQRRQHGQHACGHHRPHEPAIWCRSPKGLPAGETVVVDGADQLRDGAKITVAGPRSTGQRRRRAHAAQRRAAVAVRRQATPVAAAAAATAVPAAAAASITGMRTGGEGQPAGGRWRHRLT